MRYNKIVSLVTGAVLVAGAIAIVYEYNRYTNRYINFRVNNKSLKCSTIAEVKEYLEENTSTYLGDLDITSCVQLESKTEQLENLTFLDYIKLENKDITIDTEVVSIDYNELKKIITEYNAEQPVSSNATIVTGTEAYSITEETYGKQLDTVKIIQDLKQGTVDISSVDLDDYIVVPEITKADLQEIVGEANSYINWTIEYDSGQKFKCNIEHVSIENNSVVLNTDFISDIVKELEKVYDTAGKGFTFTDHSGTEREVLGGTYGNIMNSAEEKAYLIEALTNAKSESNRKPIMKQEYPEEIGSTYLEVSISEQHLWYYKDGELISETDVVTGDANKRRDTPTGVYFISEKINGKYLTGDTYRTWVNKWMRLTNTGIGLHDAGWRGSFGGSIYKGNGSHGCINLPKTYAYNLYEEVYRQMPVIVY